MRPTFGNIESTELSLNPKVDIVEDDKSYKLSAELPGLELDNINLDLSDGILTLSGEKKHSFYLLRSSLDLCTLRCRLRNICSDVLIIS
jgi:HSP20 family molecular chaperone IbpA